MIQQDTIRLLRECDAGVRMGIASLDDVRKRVREDDLDARLAASRREHEQLGEKIRAALRRFGDEGKAPAAVARGMAWLKASAELAAEPSRETAADLITDGCNMGVKSLSRYLNQYAAADEDSKAIARQLIALEDVLAKQMRDFL